MADEKYLRAVKEGVTIKDYFNPEFLANLESAFEGFEIIPVGLAFALEKDDTPKDTINMLHRNDDDVNNNRIMIDLNDPENMEIILKLLDSGDSDGD
ncbi:hypothetical protein [Methanobrevibacter ruminantium]|nr:hypothetical protein [Methanobrevibacter ruminantium]